MKSVIQILLRTTIILSSFVDVVVTDGLWASELENKGVVARACVEFLSSLGVNTHVSQGYDPTSYVEPLKFLGVRNIRDSGRQVGRLLMLHAQTGVRVDLAADDVVGTLQNARALAKANALLAVEGPNEPNNFPVVYNGQRGGGTKGSWVPVAQLQRDLYSAVRGDAELKLYPVFHVSEAGAENDNAGLQYLVIPVGADALLPDSTRFADYANAHNYVSGIHSGYGDNQAWQAASPTLNGRWDGLYGEYGLTWRKHFAGYSGEQLKTLPRVTTETGWDAATPGEERTQGVVLVNNFLAQFSQGWRYTFIYELGEGEGGGGHQGLFHDDWTPKLAATYIHNLASILADSDSQDLMHLSHLDYKTFTKASTVHDLLLQKSDGTFELVVWGEQVSGQNNVELQFSRSHSRVKIYDTTLGTDPIKQLTDVDSVQLQLEDHALIIELR